jgi:hypothetical protein
MKETPSSPSARDHLRRSCVRIRHRLGNSMGTPIVPARGALRSLLLMLATALLALLSVWLVYRLIFPLDFHLKEWVPPWQEQVDRWEDS